MKISVAMATYNGADYIIDQLDSIRNQSIKVDEVIISDDHSSDGTYKLVMDYIKKYELNGWKVIFDTVGKGLKDNFYSALKEVTGDIIFLADQDNLWLPKKVESIKNIMESNDKIKCLNNSFIYIDADGKQIQFQAPKGTSNNGLILQTFSKESVNVIRLPLVINKNIGPGLAMAVRREVIDIYLKTSKKAELHDYEINCIAAALDSLYYYDCVLDKYRIFEGQSVSVGIVKKRSLMSVLKQKINSAKKDLPHRKMFIDQLIKSSFNSENTEYLKKLANLYNLKSDVAVNHRIYKWPSELFLYQRIKKEDGYVDMRYCFIDLLAALFR